jgi:toxin YhaV
MVVVNGWTIYRYNLFSEQVRLLADKVERQKRARPAGPPTGHAKLLAAIRKLTTEVIPADPGGNQFRQGKTLGGKHTHWRRAKFGNGRYRLFFQYSSEAKIIIYAWVNDEQTLRTRGAKNDAYAVFKTMLGKGDPPDSWDDLAKAMGLVAN